MMPGSRAEGPKRRSGPKSKTSCYLGVTQYKRTGRWEAHIWDSGDPEFKKGRQLHLGSFPAAIPAAIAYDRAAYIIRPRNSSRNFPSVDYSQDIFIQRFAGLSKAEFVSQLRNWAQDPHLAVEYSASGHRFERPPRPPVLTPPLEAFRRQVQQPFASPAGQRHAFELLKSKRAHPTGPRLPRPIVPLLAAPQPLVLPPAAPLIVTPLALGPTPAAPAIPQPAFKKPRSQLKRRPRANIKPFVAESVAQPAIDEDFDIEGARDGQPVPAMVMLLMAMKASDGSIK